MTLSKKNFVLLSKIIRQQNRCEMCGKVGTQNAHHIISRTMSTIQRFHPKGSICVCPSCHKFGANSFHKNPIASMEWLKINKPDQYNWCLKHQKEYKWTTKRIKRMHKYLTAVFYQKQK